MGTITAWAALATALLGPAAGAGTTSPPAHPPVQVAPAGPDTAGPDTTEAPGAHLRVWLLTMGPGQAVWERFGHNAIRILDTRTGRDVSYNWGIFDFNQADFVPRFLEGQMLYSMAPYDTRGMVAAYGRDGREVVAQELALEPAQRLELQRLVEVNALPENRDYFYDYFRDNCSTRVRDVLDQVLGGALARRFRSAPTGTSYRFHIRRLTDQGPWLYTGMDLLLGAPGDRPISVWEEMFLPMTLRDAVRDVSVTTVEGAQVPLVRSEEVLVPASFPAESARPPSWLPFYLALGLLLGGKFLLLGRAAARGSAAARWGLALTVGVWSLLCGVAGLLLLAVLFTDHVFMYPNANLFLFSPLSLLVGAGGVVAGLRGRTPLWALRGAGLVLALGVLGQLLGMVGIAEQENGIFHALALPAHLGVLVALGRVGAGDDAAQLPE